MKRRELATLLTGSMMLPRLAHAQRAGLPIVGFLSSRSPQDSAEHYASFRRGLAEAGFVEGRNVAIEARWADGDYDRLPGLARELVGLRVAVIVAVGSTPSARAAKAATTTIPIAFLGPDPVRAGLVASFGRPGGNLTGVDNNSTDLGGKRLQIICEMVPHARTVAAMVNPSFQDAEPFTKVVQDAAAALGRRLVILPANSENEFDSAFAKLKDEKADALIVENDPFFDSQRTRLIALAANHAVPAIYHIREFPMSGGLVSYGASLLEGYRLVGDYCGRLLRGTNPGELPVVRPTKFELVINGQVARKLGLTVPATLLAQADEVIN